MFRKILYTLFIACALGASVLAPAHAAPNTKLTVNSTQDTNDGHCDARGTGSGNKDCTLREAINAANATTGVKETIEFAIPVTINTPGTCALLNSQCGILPTSALPDITDPVSIDGYTQPGASANTLKVGNDAKIRITLLGNNLPAASIALKLMGGKTAVRGLNLRGFGGGILIQSDKNLITGNFIGTDYTGQNSAANYIGVAIYGSNNRVGGTTPAERNVLSGNTGVGLAVYTGNQNTVQNNYIGTNAAGVGALPNIYGIYLTAANDSTIGGKGKAARNVISGNSQHGIDMFSASTGTLIQWNWIGVGANGAALANAQRGINVRSDHPTGPIPNQVTIRKNRIAQNGTQGINLDVTDKDVISRITITRNSIVGNGALGIDFDEDGITPNDKGDGDIGPNGLQNFPMIKSVKQIGGNVTVTGKLNSRANKKYRLEFFTNSSCDNSGDGEAGKFLGSLDVTTNANGNAAFVFVNAKIVNSNTIVTATATELYNSVPGSTSEISECVTVTP